jgi:DNA modification methylase
VKQLSLVEPKTPDLPEGIDIRCVSVQQLLEELTDKASLIVADPPWQYSQKPGHAHPERHYELMTDHEIVDVLNKSHDIVENGRLALWCTWPKMGELWTEMKKRPFKWRYVSGGSWTKISNTPGVGYHWTGASEPVLLFKSHKSRNLCRTYTGLSNAYVGERRRHSEKPEEWMQQWLEQWTEPGELVVDLWSGLSPLARCCARLGRRYIGAEIDPERHKMALGLFATSDTSLIR